MNPIRIKRIYEPPWTSDGTRILVDRLWPRGITREEARIDAWIKEAAPSDALRRWYSHDPKKWPLFRTRYLTELQQNPAAAELRNRAREANTMTLLFASKDAARNNAIVLREFLEGAALAKET
jgi:uncharacterized protein YeaO (DUF488 family)